MSRANLITKFGLEKEVDTLLENGYSVYKISEIIQSQHQDNPELVNLSHMAVQRYRDSRDKDKLELINDKGEDVSDIIVEEFREANKHICEGIRSLIEEGKTLYKKTEDEGSLQDQIKAHKEKRDDLVQLLKTYESRIQYGVRQIKFVDQINQKKVQNLNIIMVDIANDLCPECKRQILEKLKNIVSE